MFEKWYKYYSKNIINNRDYADTMQLGVWGQDEGEFINRG